MSDTYKEENRSLVVGLRLGDTTKDRDVQKRYSPVVFRPMSVEIKFTSISRGPWYCARAEATGANIKKNGETGTKTHTQAYYAHRWSGGILEGAPEWLLDIVDSVRPTPGNEA